MFYTLHKLVKCALLLVLVALGWAVYSQRALFTPLEDLFLAWHDYEPTIPAVRHELTGDVVRVFDGRRFQVRTPKGSYLNLILEGLEGPTRFSPNRTLAEAGRQHLSQLVLSNRIRFEVTFSNRLHFATGIAFLGETNVNVAMARTGTVVPGQQGMDRLPFSLRYQILRAEREAKGDSD